ncbi:MAG: hypothetical protein EZS28_027534, partial [Streblomastix strix]
MPHFFVIILSQNVDLIPFNCRKRSDDPQIISTKLNATNSILLVIYLNLLFECVICLSSFGKFGNYAKDNDLTQKDNGINSIAKYCVASSRIRKQIHRDESGANFKSLAVSQPFSNRALSKSCRNCSNSLGLVPQKRYISVCSQQQPSTLAGYNTIEGSLGTIYQDLSEHLDIQVFVESDRFRILYTFGNALPILEINFTEQMIEGEFDNIVVDIPASVEGYYYEHTLMYLFYGTNPSELEQLR